MKKYMIIRMVEAEEVIDAEFPTMMVQGPIGEPVEFVRKEGFDNCAIEVGENDFVSKEVVEKWLENCEVETKELFGKPHTFVHCQLPNKFIISEQTSCVDPKNYSEEIGAKICKEKLKDKIWYILGAHLSSAKYGVNN